MVLGCTSSAGKSLITAALCRWFVRQGVCVAPFKAQNMSNNARVVDGGEIGVAQWLQARAARVEPDVRMNPVLVKPEAETQSQVVVLGRADPAISAMPWEARHDLVWEPMRSSFDSLRSQFDLVVIEGAGSPAEINLRDQVNNRTLEYADAAGLLVSNIDLGGSFAHLYGTWALVPDATRERLTGFVLNQFRGDPTLLAPGPSRLTGLTGMAHLATVPMIDHDLPDEEGAVYRRSSISTGRSVGVVRLPFGSNLDEFHALARAGRLRVVGSPGDLDGCDIVIVPGSKHVASDMAWMRRTGLADALVLRARAGGRTIGVCGGAMMLGTAVDDPEGVEGSCAGLGLLPIRTVMQPDKLVRRTSVRFGGLPEAWSMLDARRASGYEIRHRRVTAFGPVGTVDPCVWADGVVLATTVHGCFEEPEVVAALVGGSVDTVDAVDRTLDQLADAVEDTFDHGALWRMVEPVRG
ncbi:MAG: cobyric acid synthase [Ilumatobacteraceae bacterium]